MLPEILLDDLRFQELVSEARTRIVRHSPDWTEHNVSDPGVTLIELFAWLTEILSYRINRIPERLQLSLLELVGVRPAAPESASTELRFIAAAPPAEELVIPAGVEVASPRTSGQESVVFRTTEAATIPAARMSAYATERAGQVKAVAMTGGRAEPSGALQAPFSTPPIRGDAMLLGFDRPIGGLVVRIEVECARARGDGIDPAAPPLRWEASGDDGEWHAAAVVSDETGGFLHGDGAIVVELPPQTAAAGVAGKQLHWLRCRVSERSRAGARVAYASPPEIGGVSATVVGAVAPATHAATVLGEVLGVSEGAPGATYTLHHHPVLEPEEGETLEVRLPGSDAWEPWERVDTFAQSVGTDRHFMLDTARGQVRFGPAIRQPDGGWRRYGAVPARGAALRFSRYRHGGGIAGNVAPRALTLLQTPVPGIASVTNPRAAAGGLDAEPLASARDRAAIAIRARTRAVTAEDFERLTLESSPEVARAVCVAGAGAGPLRVHVLPRVEAPDRQLTLEELTPTAELMASVAARLDERRLLGTSVRLLPVRLRGVSVVVDVRASPLADTERVQQDVAHALYTYLNPLIGGSPEGPGDGWPLGRVLNQGELFGIVYGISGVEFVNILRMYETDLRTGEQAAQPIESHFAIEPDELIASGRHIVKAIHSE
jgi:predicted phage baseplate assembly protein